jgi:hypothetical protein
MSGPQRRGAYRSNGDHEDSQQRREAVGHPPGDARHQDEGRIARLTNGPSELSRRIARTELGELHGDLT